MKEHRHCFVATNLGEVSKPFMTSQGGHFLGCLFWQTLNFEKVSNYENKGWTSLISGQFTDGSVNKLLLENIEREQILLNSRPLTLKLGCWLLFLLA